MTREKITLTAEFKAAVREYQQKNNLPSWSQALLQLAVIGYRAETKQEPPKPYETWGGKRERK